MKSKMNNYERRQLLADKIATTAGQASSTSALEDLVICNAGFTEAMTLLGDIDVDGATVLSAALQARLTAILA